MHFSPVASVLILAVCLLGSSSVPLGAASPALTQIVGPTGSSQYGSMVKALPSGNVVVVDPTYTSATYGSAVGAVYLYDVSGALISTLTGDMAGDNVGGGGVTVLEDGNFVVNSPKWHSNTGAVTWVNGVTGRNEVVSAQNSVVGNSTGYGEAQTVTPLKNGAYLICMPYWKNGTIPNVGAVAWSSSASPLVGELSAENALVGSSNSDLVGMGTQAVKVLKNGNYVVISTSWDNGSAQDAGAITWGSGATGVRGAVSAANSLVGSTTGDRLGSDYGGITELPNGNYLVLCQGWQSGGAAIGAVTWGSGTSGVAGPVSAANSLIGSSTVCAGKRGFTILANGNYVVRSVNSSYDANGMVTWGDGATGTAGVISAANSLRDASLSPGVGEGGVYPLTNGNYVVVSQNWVQPLSPVTTPGAVTWCRGDGPTAAVITPENSLIGTGGGVSITALTNGNYVVRCPEILRGAVTWASGTCGARGPVTVANSLVGTSTYNYYYYNLVSPGSGTVLLQNSTANLTFNSVAAKSITLSSASSLTKSSTSNPTLSGSNTYTGATTVVNTGGLTINAGATLTLNSSTANLIVFPGWGSRTLRGGVVALKNGNYVVRVPGYDGNRGAVVWGDGSSGITGEVSEQNALVGHERGDEIGSGGVVPLANGNYVVLSPSWDASTAAGNVGALTWSTGTAPTLGRVTVANSLVGSTQGDSVGGTDAEPATGWLSVINVGSVLGFQDDLVSTDRLVLDNGNFVMVQPNWKDASTGKWGAVTWINGATGTTGVISAENAQVGAFGTLTPLPDGNYLVRMPDWSNGGLASAGALRWVDSTKPLTGVVSSENSLVGSRANDRVGQNNTYTYTLYNVGILNLTSGASLALVPVNYGPTLQVLKNGHYVVSVGWVEPGAETVTGRRSVVFGQAGQGVTGEVSAVQSLTFPETYFYPSYPIPPYSNMIVPRGNLVLNAFAIPFYHMQHRLAQEAVRQRLIIGAPGASLVNILPYSEDFRPEITVLQGVDALLDGGEPHLFSGGESPPSGPNLLQRAFSIRNDGTAPLTGLLVTKDGLNAADFQVSALSTSTLPPGASVSFEVTFTPRAGGVRTATLHIASNDGDENTFEINLQGEYTGTGLPSGTLAIDAPANSVIYAAESDGFAYIPLVRTGGAVGNVTVNVTTAEGTAKSPADFIALQSSPFTLGDSVMEAKVPITLLDPPNTHEVGERFVVRLSGASVTPGGTDSVTVHILDSVGDTTAPRAPSITTPLANSVLSVYGASPIVISGRATDNESVATVKVKINDGSLVNATLASPDTASTAYSVELLPVAGTNTITVQTVDGAGNLSPAVTRTIKVLRPLVVTMDYLRGSVTAGYYPVSFREVGRPLTITATAKAGSIFTGWTIGGADAAMGGAAFTPERLGLTTASLERNTITFTFREGLTLAPRFIANPFAPVAGSYNGLIRYFSPVSTEGPAPLGTLTTERANQATATLDANDGAPPVLTPRTEEWTGPNEMTEGLFKATVQPTGAFSATIAMEGVTSNISGVFDSQGVARFGTARSNTLSVPRAGKDTLQVSLHVNLDSNGANGSITGFITRVTAGGEAASYPNVSSVDAPRNFYTGLTPATTVPAAYLRPGNANGVYTAALQTAYTSGEPSALGYGYATVTLTKSGLMTFSGVQPDGTSWSASSSLSKDNQCPLFVSFPQRNLRTGYLIGLIVLDDMESSDFRSLGGYWQPPSQIPPILTVTNNRGQVSSVTQGRPVPFRFFLKGAKFAPVNGESVLPGVAEAPGRVVDLMMQGGGLTSLQKAASLSPADYVTRIPATDNSFTLAVTRATGIFSGNFDYPGTAAKASYKGVVLQKGSEAGGYGHFIPPASGGNLTVRSLSYPTFNSGNVLLTPRVPLPPVVN